MTLLPPALPAHGLGDTLVFVELVQQALEPVGDALPQHFVVNALKDVAEPSLVLATEAPSSLSHLRVCMHGRLLPRGLGLHRVRLRSLLPRHGRRNRLAFTHCLVPGRNAPPGPLSAFISA